MSGKSYAGRDTCPYCGGTILIDCDTQNGSHVCGSSEPLTIKGWVKLILLILVIGLILFSLCVFIGEHRDKQHRKREAVIAHPGYLKMSISHKKDAMETIKKYREWGFNESSFSYEISRIEDADKVIEYYRKKTQEKVRNGYLKLGHMYYGDYKEVFGDEEWWPEKYK